MKVSKTKIIVILGPTASGKSALAVRLAKKFNGEVISADSRQVYKGLNIGTGKITKKEMAGVPHHLLDVANPKKRFTVVEFAERARRAISDIARRGRAPIICGGTGFYIDALIYNIEFPPVEANLPLRSALSKKTAAELFFMLGSLAPERAGRMNLSDRKNPVRLIRAIEIATAPVSREKKRGRRQTSRPAVKTNLKLGIMPSHNIQYEPLFIGLKVQQDELKRLIRVRLLKRIRHGLIPEAKKLHKLGLSWKRMEELGLEYRHLALFLQNKIIKQDLIEKLNTEIWHYAKRQKTWFNRNKKINWFKPRNIKQIEKKTARYFT